MRNIAIRWNDPDPKYVPLFCEAGITAVIAPAEQAFASACAAAGIETAAESDLQFVSTEDAGKTSARRPVVIKSGLWPGVHRQDPQVAGATRSLWMDQNCSLVHYLRAMYPRVSPVLGYLPDKDAGVSPDQLLSFDSVELALAEAWVSGGNYVMALHPGFREGLLKRAPEAMTAWRRIGVTAKWLRANESLFRQPALPIVTVLVDRSDLSQEIAQLSFRHNVSPSLAPAADPPAPDAARHLVLVAVGIEPPQGKAQARILAHAEAGTTVIVDGRNEGAWWKTPSLNLVRSDAERNFYACGKGQIVAYKESVDDPGMLALDIIDIVTQKRRPARIWNCNAGLVMASLAPRAGAVKGTAILNVINYSRPVDLPVLARIQGHFKTAVLLRPGSERVELKVSPRGTASEVSIPQLARLATVVFS